MGLAALAALVLPLLIHLSRRDIQRPIAFAALRWLEPRPKPRRRPRIDERALLAARLALLALLALVLARPAWRGESGPQAWLAVAPGADPAAARALAPKGAHLRWLAPGFPGLGRQAPTGPAPISSLLRELDADLPPGATLTVAVPAVLRGLDAERPRLSRPVDWRVLPGATPILAKPAAPAAPPTLIIRYAPGFEAGARYLRAAAEALGPSRGPGAPDASPSREPLPQDARAIAWLAPGPLPAAVRDRLARGAVVLLPAEALIDDLGPATPIWRDAEGRTLAEGGGLGHGLWRRFTRPLESETMPELLAPDFPTRLAGLLVDPPPPALAQARDLRPLLGARPGAPAAQDMTPLLALFVIALFALERWLATRAQRAQTP
jgi:hypothetical protein